MEDERRKEIRETYYQPGGFIILAILTTIGIVLLYFSGVFSIHDYDSLIHALERGLVPIIFSLFFIFIFLYCIKSYIVNIIVKPKKELMHTFIDDEGDLVFANSKGKVFYYPYTKDLKEQTNYYVAKTKDYIYYVIEETNDDFKVKPKGIKESFWLNMYTPHGDFHDIMLLPILYVIALPGYVAILLSPGFYKLYGCLYTIYPTYLIIYDIIEKYKNKNK